MTVLIEKTKIMNELEEVTLGFNFDTVVLRVDVFMACADSRGKACLRANCKR